MASFEESLSELERVVERLEKGNLPLEESLRLFERGMVVSRECKSELEAAEGRIQKLVLGRDGRELRTEDLQVPDEEEDNFGDDGRL